jgi:hypothetical protein
MIRTMMHARETRMIDYSFGIFGAIPRWRCRRDALELENHLQFSRPLTTL